MRYLLPIILVILILFRCDSSNTRKAATIPIIIKEPKLLELTSSNPEFSKAVTKMKEHLTSLNVPIDSMYFVDVDSTSDEWEIQVIHYDNYIEQAKYNVEKKRIDSLKNAGVKGYYVYMPPTGNWGGHDRTLIYSRKDRRIIADHIYQ